MPGDEIGHQILLLSGRGRLVAKLLGEGLELFDGRLVHSPQHLGVGMLGRHLQKPAGVVLHQVADVGGASQRPSPCGRPEATKGLLHARLPPHSVEQPDERPVIRGQQPGRSPAGDSSIVGTCSRTSGRVQFI